MGLHLVTGHSGTPHVTSADQGLYNAMIAGKGDYVLSYGDKFKAELRSNSNLFDIYGGCLLMQGRFVTMDSGETMSIPIGNAGVTRHDIISVQYEKNVDGTESVSFHTTMGTESTKPIDPAITNSAPILNGSTVYKMPLYRVVSSAGIITKIEPLFTELAPMADFHRSFYKQNLLINGDFQCNQRGEKKYSVGNVVGGQYTVDMWRAYQVDVEKMTGNVLSGVTVSGRSSTEQGFFTQFIQLGALVTKTYTISAKINDEICTFTETPGGSAKEKNFGTFKISFLTTSTWDSILNGYNNKLKINICPMGTSTLYIEYIDVFEGNVAYPHVKEDPATALMRCRQYIQAGLYTASIMYKTIVEAYVYKHTVAICFDRMACTEKTQPQLEMATMTYVQANATNGETTTTNFADNTNNSATLTDANGMFTVKFVCSEATATYPAVKGRYLVTCEPRDA